MNFEPEITTLKIQMKSKSDDFEVWKKKTAGNPEDSWKIRNRQMYEACIAGINAAIEVLSRSEWAGIPDNPFAMGK